MSRLTTIDSVCFPVVERAVFTTIEGPDGTQHLPVPSRKALVNGHTGRVLGVVSRGYRVVTNNEALAWALECCRQVFPDTKEAEWNVDWTDAPASGGHCSIDLVHASAGISFVDVRPGAKPEAFGPFIRVTNSYNGLRALTFDIGFHRKVCRNGLIAPDTIIQFRFAHQHRELGSGVKFAVASQRLEALKGKFRTYIAAVAKCPVARSQFEPLVRAVLRLRVPRSPPPQSREAEEWAALQVHLSGLIHKYAAELGENGYAVLNTITDFASRPPQNQHVHRDRHSLQRLAGQWLNDFSQACRRPEFKLADHLAGLEKKSAEARAEGGRGSIKAPGAEVRVTA